jgi:hypothetical protein
MFIRIGVLSAALIFASAALSSPAHAGSWTHEGQRHWSHQGGHMHGFYPPRHMAFPYNPYRHRYVYVLPPRASYWNHRSYCR